MQELYLDICKLLSYAYPGPEDAQFLRVAGVDAFLTALDNDEMRRNVAVWQPKTIDEALHRALVFEAYSSPKRMGIFLPRQLLLRLRVIRKAKKTNSLVNLSKLFRLG